MGRIFSDIFDWFLDGSNLTWPVKLLLSVVVGVFLLSVFGDYLD